MQIRITLQYPCRITGIYHTECSNSGNRNFNVEFYSLQKLPAKNHRYSALCLYMQDAAISARYCSKRPFPSNVIHSSKRRTKRQFVFRACSAIDCRKRSSSKSRQSSSFETSRCTLNDIRIIQNNVFLTKYRRCFEKHEIFLKLCRCYKLRVSQRN